MLHFPSTSTSARVARKADREKLSELLGDDVWAFSNCRVEAAHKPVAELDWLFYNTTLGTLMISEWKRYPDAVAEAKDRGDKWRLRDGSLQSNPLEQVDKQQDALRWALREKILPGFFPDHIPHSVKVMESVYCPQIAQDTVKDRLQFGRLFSTVEELCTAVNTLRSPAPLLVTDMGSVLDLAKALATLFRCSVPAGLEESAVWQHNPKESATFWEKARRIHSDIAALHQQMADLIESEFAPRSVAPAENAAKRSPDDGGGAENSEDWSELITKHVAAHLTGADGMSEDFDERLGRALHAILVDVPKGSWVRFPAIGSAIGPFLGVNVKLRKILRAPLWEWSLGIAKKYGLSAEVDDSRGNIRIVDGHKPS